MYNNKNDNFPATCPDNYFYQDPMIRAMVNSSTLLENKMPVFERTGIEKENGMVNRPVSKDNGKTKIEYVKIKKGEPLKPDILLSELIDSYESEEACSMERSETNLAQYRVYTNRKNYISSMRNIFSDMLDTKAREIESESLRDWSERYRNKNNSKTRKIYDRSW